MSINVFRLVYKVTIQNVFLVGEANSDPDDNIVGK